MIRAHAYIMEKVAVDIFLEGLAVSHGSLLSLSSLHTDKWALMQQKLRYAFLCLHTCISYTYIKLVRFVQGQSVGSAGWNVILGFAAQSVDPGFAQQNPWIVRIHTLRLTYFTSAHIQPVIKVEVEGQQREDEQLVKGILVFIFKGLEQNMV